MITMRDLARADRAIGSITDEECLLISEALKFIVAYRTNWIFRLFLPKTLQEKALSLTMLAATLGRTIEERQPLQMQIQKAMNEKR